MKAVIITLLLAGSLWASGTTVAETTVVRPGCQPPGVPNCLANGYIRITPTAAFVGADGSRVEMVTTEVPVKAGAFSVILQPNDTGLPANTRYTVLWHLVGMTPDRTDVWNVPTSNVTLRVSDVTSSSIPPSAMVALSQLSQGGATSGQCMGWSGSSWGPIACGAGGTWTPATVACGASPNLDFSLGNILVVTLNCSVSSISVSHIQVGKPVIIMVCEDATPNRSWPWPAAIKGGWGVGTMANKCTLQWFYSGDGVTLFSTGLPTMNQ